jgi:RNA polymerase sigma-70 factor (ECF subfamily)
MIKTQAVDAVEVTGEGLLVNGLTASIQRKESISASRTGRKCADMDKEYPCMDRNEVSFSDDAHALSDVYERFRRPIHSYVSRLLNSQEDADDVTQEVFVRLFIAWDGLHDRDHLSAWLYRLATNLSIDLLRRHKRISWWPLAWRRMGDQPRESRAEEDDSYLPPDSGGIPEIFEREHMRLALASIPQEYAIVLVLNAAQGVPYQEVAAIIGISPGAAATRISRAKKMFREHYQRIGQAL